MSTGRLTVSTTYHGPSDVRKENRDRAPWAFRTVTLLEVDGITQDDAVKMVSKLRESNVAMVIAARWDGPSTI